ncbi:hypothetical protein Tco_0078865 [Tanacetum coccineum]
MKLTLFEQELQRARQQGHLHFKFRRTISINEWKWTLNTYCKAHFGQEQSMSCVITLSGKLNVTKIDTYDEHTIAMPFSLAACADVTIMNTLASPPIGRALQLVCFIKDEGGRTITDEEEIKKIRGEYFSSLFNAREPEGREEVVDPIILSQFVGYYSRISHAEVRTALQKMGRNKVVRLDQIPIEAWRSLREEGIIWLTSPFNKIFTGAKMPEEWRLSNIIPIFKNKGDARDYHQQDEGRTVEVVRTCQEKTTVSTSKRVKVLVVDGLRKKDRPKLRWDRVKHDMEELLLFEDIDRNEWRARIKLGS